LWQRALEDVQANAPWQRLRPSLLLLLQLLALLALVLALAAPAYSRSHTYAGDLIVIVDQSYGMQARDVSPTRFDVALRRARTLAAELGSGSVMSVIGMGAQPYLEIAESDDQSAIDAAIAKLRPGVSSPNFLGALSLASSLARSGVATQAVLLTSRESGISSLPLQTSFPLDVIRIGADSHGGAGLRDLGITAASAVASGAHAGALVRVGNFGYRVARSDLNLYVDGQLADVRPLTVPPGKQVNLFWTDLPAGTHVIRARIMRRDDVDADKSAWAVVSHSAPRHVLLVTHGDYFLQTALQFDPSIVLTMEQPGQYTAPKPSAGYPDANGVDLTIFDGTLPAQLPSTPVLLIGPPSGRVGPIRVGTLTPAGTATDAPTPSDAALAGILQYADLSDVHVAVARQVSLPGWVQPLVVSAGYPHSGSLLLAAGNNGQTRVAIVPFQLQESDWPLRISFPVVMQNLVHYLAPGLTPGSASVVAGAPVALSAPPGAPALELTLPDGAHVTLRPPFPPFTDTSRPGVYTVREPGTNRTAVFVVNFFPSRPAPAPPSAVAHLGNGSSHLARRASAPESVAWLFGLVGLIVLSAEWWYAFRR
ncbi:MAG: VWA domain-containing protein, partial [Chloroflexota bacterium]|nr:VWA domain-containing protein [Chloroflexota bacterium]